MPSFGPAEWLVILAIVLLLFGAKKLPDLARSLGKSSREFKKGLSEGADPNDRSDEPVGSDKPEPPAPPQPPAENKNN